jgi:hypothetical protein
LIDSNSERAHFLFDLNLIFNFNFHFNLSLIPPIVSPLDRLLGGSVQVRGGSALPTECVKTMPEQAVEVKESTVEESKTKEVIEVLAPKVVGRSQGLGGIAVIGRQCVGIWREFVRSWLLRR